MAGTDAWASTVAVERRLLQIARRAWWRLSPNDLQESWVDDVLPELLVATGVAQAAAVDVGAGTVRRAVIRSGLIPPPQVKPAAFVGAGSSGMPMARVLSGALVRTLTVAAAGAADDVALETGWEALDRTLTTEVQDAMRGGASTAITATRQVTGYIRWVEPGACSRCIILSGKRYRWSAGFDRHPRCRCSNIPDTVADSQRIKSPQQIYEGMTQDQRVAAFGAANTKAIEHGADMNRVVNATGSRAGLSTTITTPDGKLKATMAAARKGHPRLVPESIYRLAGDDREYAIRLLRLHGYIQ